MLCSNSFVLKYDISCTLKLSMSAYVCLTSEESEEMRILQITQNMMHSKRNLHLKDFSLLLTKIYSLRKYVFRETLKICIMSLTVS